MNANELADELDYCYGKEYPCPVSKEAATMLRQQQAEIEALKAGKIRAYDNGVEDGRKPDTNNKPVAWMSKKGILSYVNDMGFTIPLYTHPAELTDEEIEQVWTEVTCQELNVPYSFARAILRKAQEK